MVRKYQVYNYCIYLPADYGHDDGEAYSDVLPHSRRVIGVGLQPIHPAGQEQILAELQPVKHQVAGQVRNLPVLSQEKMVAGAVRSGWLAHSRRSGRGV